MTVDIRFFEAARTRIVQAYSSIRALEDADEDVLQDQYEDWREAEHKALGHKTTQRPIAPSASALRSAACLFFWTI